MLLPYVDAASEQPENHRMRMQTCPQCGAENSVKRTTCYQCQAELKGQSEEVARLEATSRWDTIETKRGRVKQRPLRPATDANFPTLHSTSDKPRETARNYMPMVRSALGHIRRMAMFFRELHTMTLAGINLAAACRQLERRGPGNLRALARDMAQAVEFGQPISSVLEKQSGLLYRWHIGLMKAAEAGGFLPEAFDQIAHAYEIEWETRSALRLRMFIYLFFGIPAILITLPSILLMAHPIPEKGWTPESVVATLMDYCRTVSLPIAIIIVGMFLVWQVLASTAWFQGVQQRIVLRLPIVGRVARAAALDRYLATLGLMLRGGIPVGEAAEQAALAAGNASLTPKLLKVGAALRDGISLSDALTKTRVFDRDAIHMTETGEISGSLPNMLMQAAGYYRSEQEFKRRMLLRVASIAISVLWLGAAGTLFIIGVKTYFDYVFRVMDWMMQ